MSTRGFFRAISHWDSYNKITVEYNVNELVDDESEWSAKGLVKYAMSSVSPYSTALMQVVTALVVIKLVISVKFKVWETTGRALEGMTTLIIIITIFIDSIIMISLGIIGYYIARVYEKFKGRLKYKI